MAVASTELQAAPSRIAPRRDHGVIYRGAIGL